MSRLSFDNTDYVKDVNNNVISVLAPKDINRLEEISELRNQQRKIDEEDDDDNDNVKLKISNQSFDLNNLDVHNIEEPKLNLMPDLLIDDIEILDDL